MSSSKSLSTSECWRESSMLFLFSECPCPPVISMLSKRKLENQLCLLFSYFLTWRNNTALRQCWAVSVGETSIWSMQIRFSLSVSLSREFSWRLSLSIPFLERTLWRTQIYCNFLPMKSPQTHRFHLIGWQHTLSVPIKGEETKRITEINCLLFSLWFNIKASVTDRFWALDEWNESTIAVLPLVMMCLLELRIKTRKRFRIKCVSKTLFRPFNVQSYKTWRETKCHSRCQKRWQFSLKKEKKHQNKRELIYSSTEKKMKKKMARVLGGYGGNRQI